MWSVSYYVWEFLCYIYVFSLSKWFDYVSQVNLFDENFFNSAILIENVYFTSSTLLKRIVTNYISNSQRV